MDFDAWKELGLPTGAPEAQVRSAYRRRLDETDPSRVRGMDPAIVRAAARARERVELAFGLLTDPKGLPAGAVDRFLKEEAGAEIAPPPDPPSFKSYWRAVTLTLMFPGAGSWYAGGRKRGLLVMLAFAAVTILLLKSAHASLRAMPRGGNPVEGLMGGLELIREVSGWFTSLVFLCAGDAVMAAWAHNDAERARARKG